MGSFTNTIFIALLTYDYALTVQKEVTLIWRRKFSPTTALFILNRYGAICYSMLDTATVYIRGHKVWVDVFNIHVAHEWGTLGVCHFLSSSCHH